MFGRRLGARGWEVDAVEPGLAVGVGRDDEVPGERPFGSGGNANVRPPGELQHAERIRRRLVDGLVAGDCRHGEHVELGAPKRKEERERVVLARVAVDENRNHATTAPGTSTGTTARPDALSRSASRV